MLRNSFLSVLFLLALSCVEEKDGLTEDSTVEGAIGFVTSEDGLRSTGVLDGNTLSNMTVYAYYTGQDVFSAAAVPAPNFMSGQRVAKSGGAWTYSPVKYWPMSNGKVSFFAVAAATGSGLPPGVVYGGASSYPSFTVTPPASPSKQEDICVASVFDLDKDSYAGGTVPLTFEHAMAKVSFSASYTGTMPTGGYIKVKQVHLTGVAASGTLSFTPAAVNPAGFGWTAGSNTTNYFLSMSRGDLEDIELIKGTPTPISTGQGVLLLVPQDAGNARVQVIVAFNDGTSTEENEYEVTATLSPATWKAGEQVTYSLVIDLDNKYMLLDVPGSIIPGVNQWEYPSDGYSFSAPGDGYYMLEAWGMDGDDSHGGYVKGTLYLKENQEIYIRVSKGGTGGATDFRLVDGVWSLPKGLNSRIMVAGGGGGDEAGYGTAGDAGGLVGYGGEGGEGGTQTGGGDSFGCGGGTLSSPGGDGGDGYYGGDGGDNGSAGGGSSFISGMTGCIAIDPTNYGFPRAQDKIGYDASLNYSDAEFFTSPTWPDGAEILFTNVSMIDGSGYEWNTGVKGAIPVGLPARGGIYARITRIIVNP